MIKRLSLGGFKPFRDKHDVRLAPITLIYGPNSGGKSSLLQSLLLLKQTLLGESAKTGVLVPSGSIVDLGSFLSVVHAHDPSSSLTLGLQLEIRGILPSITMTYAMRQGASTRDRGFGMLSDVRYAATDAATQRQLFNVGLTLVEPQPTYLRDMSTLRGPSYCWKDPDTELPPLLNFRAENVFPQLEPEPEERQRLAHRVEQLESLIYKFDETLEETERQRHASIARIEELRAVVGGEIATRKDLLERTREELERQRDALEQLKEVYATVKTEGLLPIISREQDRLEKMAQSLSSIDDTIGCFESEEERSERELLEIRTQYEERRTARLREERHSLVEERQRTLAKLSRLEQDNDERLSSLARAHVLLSGGLPGSLVSAESGSPLPPTNETFVFGGFRRLLDDVLSQVSHLGPSRCPASRYYVGLGEPHSSVGATGEFTPHLLSENPDLVSSEIDRWLKQFQIPYTVKIKHLGDELIGNVITMVLEDSTSGKPVELSSSDVGFGISQLLPILVEGSSSRQRVLCVEQPEIHLHPRLQAHLADFFIETSCGVNEDGTLSIDSGNQWLVETHSETLMLRFQRRLREGRIKPESIAVIYVDPPSKGNPARVMKLRLDDDGNFLDEWPSGFFEEGYDELFG